MRYITKHIDHVYTTKSSAMRAARNAVGHSFLVESPEMENRFDGVIRITTDMISVESCEGGWRWAYTFDLADVTVRVHHADGSIADVRYADVAHWQDAYTPVDDSLHSLAMEALTYLRAYDAAGRGDDDLREVHDRHMPHLLDESTRLGVGLDDIFDVCHTVENALLSSNPHYIAEIILRAQPLGLVSDELRAHLRTWALRRGVSPAKYLRMAKEILAQRAA